MTNRETIAHYLDCVRRKRFMPDAELSKARACFQGIFVCDYAQGAGNLWIRNHAEEVVLLMAKEPAEMSLHEALVCITNIVARDHAEGTISASEMSGLMIELLQQYMNLTEDEEDVV